MKIEDYFAAAQTNLDQAAAQLEEAHLLSCYLHKRSSTIVFQDSDLRCYHEKMAEMVKKISVAMASLEEYRKLHEQVKPVIAPITGDSSHDLTLVKQREMHSMLLGFLSRLQQDCESWHVVFK